MMAQDNLVVAGIDVAKDKVDVCIRSQSLRRAFASTPEGRRELASWLRRRKVRKAVMEASGGYEREWAKTLRTAPGSRFGLLIPSGSAASLDRLDGLPRTIRLMRR
jgi:transposase